MPLRQVMAKLRAAADQCRFQSILPKARFPIARNEADRKMVESCLINFYFLNILAIMPRGLII